VHVCPCCVGMWRSMDLEQGFPRMRSLWGRVCVFVNQGVCRFMQWSMIVTDNLVGGMGLARYIASLWPPRIWFPSLPKASPPSWFQAEDLFSSVFLFSWSIVCSSSRCLLDRGFRSRWPVSQSGSRRCILGFWAIDPRALMVVLRGIIIRGPRVSL